MRVQGLDPLTARTRGAVGWYNGAALIACTVTPQPTFH